MSGGNPEIRGYRSGDESRISAAMGSGPEALDEWAWRYPSYPMPRALTVAERDGAIVAWCGGRRVRLWDGRAVRPAATVQEVGTVGETDGPDDLRTAVVRRLVSDMAAERRPVLAGAGVLGPLASGSTSIDVTTLKRERSRRAPSNRLRYRAELARDWEPRLDGLWRRALPRDAVGVVRDAEHGLQRFAGHPTARFHRFVVLPRFGREATAWVAFEIAGGVCRWSDLQWDRGHRGALALAAHLSAGVARQFGATAEEIVVGGDTQTRHSLERLGFACRETSRISIEFADPEAPSGRATDWSSTVLTAADIDLLEPGRTG